MEVLGGFLIGFLGSFHCVGMCGPIALALPVYGDSNFSRIFGRVLYNLGRVVTYSMFGLLLGAFGQRLVLIGFQENVSLISGIIILAYVLMPRSLKSKLAQNYYVEETNKLVKKGLSRFLRSKSVSALFFIGLLNGLLPCGFVYVALAGSLAMNGALNGALFMALFGLGTVPIMFATSLAGQYLSMNIRRRVNRLVPVFAVVIALLFILRGLSLGIPYVSPKLHSPVNKTVEEVEHGSSCH